MLPLSSFIFTTVLFLLICPPWSPCIAWGQVISSSSPAALSPVTYIQQDSALRSRRDSFSGSGLSSPALQQSHRDSFSGLPAGHLNKNVSLTDPIREGRIAGGLRSGPVQPHPRAACPDTRLDIGATPPKAAAVSHSERPPTVLDIPESGRLETTRCPESSQRRGSRSPRRHPRKRPRNRSSALYRPKKLPPHPGHWCE